MEELFVVYDGDPGTDDAWGILTLLRASEAALNLLNILAITTAIGNTDVYNATSNAMRLLASANRSDIPVYQGCHEPLGRPNQRESFYGEDGFGDVLPMYEVPHNQNHAVNMMYKIVKENPKNVSFVVAGPLTNIATCHVMFDDFLDNVKEIWLLGADEGGQSVPFNYRADPVAADIILRDVKIPVYVLPSKAGREANSGIDLKFRFDYLGSVDSPQINLLNTAEKSIFLPKGYWIAYDSFLVFSYLFRGKVILKCEMYHAEMVTTGENAGQMILSNSMEENVCVIQKLDGDYYKQVIAWVAGVPGVNDSQITLDSTFNPSLSCSKCAHNTAGCGHANQKMLLILALSVAVFVF